MDVLIAGAGPTGLLLALCLARRGIAVRIIDKKSGPTDESRAVVVQARTLEFYAQLGIADDVVADGIPIENLHMLRPHGEDAIVEIANLGAGITPYPHVLCYPQDRHEKLLIAKLREAGVEVEWNNELSAVTAHDDRVEVVTARDSSTVKYVCGCDGGHSRVREALGIAFEGGDYEHKYFVVDARITGASARDIRISFDDKILGLSFPVRPDEARLIGLVPTGITDAPAITFDDLRADVESLLRITVEKVNWFSIFRVAHRVASRFNLGRCFLAGDAGHVHSPVGGQGMNTGLGDAFNLAWKLAAVLQSRAAPSILATYEAERIAFARMLVATTDSAFQQLVDQGWRGRLARAAAPRLVPLAFDIAAARRAFFTLVSQVHIHYPDSALSDGKAGELRGGDRLPWVHENFAPLRSLDWQVHIYGEATTTFAIPTHVFAFDERAQAAGIAKNAAYLIRPDGYIALAMPNQNAKTLNDYLTKHAITPK